MSISTTVQPTLLKSEKEINYISSNYYAKCTLHLVIVTETNTNLLYLRTKYQRRR